MVSLKRLFLSFDCPQPAERRRVRRHPEQRAAYLEALEERQLFAGTPSQLVFLGQPSQVAAGSPMNPSIQIAIEDFQSNIVTTDTSTIRLIISSSPLNGTFSQGSTVSVVASGGVANFTNVSFTTIGAYTITATTVPPNLTSLVSNQFTVTPAATHLAFVTPPSDVTAGALFPNSISVAIQDSNNNLVTTDQSNVTLTISTGPSGGTLTGTTTVRAINGIATFVGVTLPKAGSYKLQAKDSSTGIASTTTASSFTVSPGNAASLTFSQQPTSAPGSTVLTPPPVVSVIDAFGNVVASDSSTITLTIASGPGGGSIAGQFQMPATAGVATFNNISFPVFGNYTIQASDGSLNAVTSNSFAITGPAVQLAFQIQPSQTTVGHTMPAITVLVQDAGGNVVTNDSSSVTISIATGTSPGTLSGTTMVTAVNGVATFSGLSISESGTYTLDVADGFLTNATSNSFVINGLPAKLEFGQQPGPAAAAAPLPSSVTVKVEDSAGNTVLDDNSLVTIVLNGGTLTGTTVVNASNGVATFTNLIPAAAGTFTLGASDGVLAGATSSTFIVSRSASKVIFLQQPVPVAATSTMPAVTVEIDNDDNNRVITTNAAVTLAIVSGPNNATLSGTTTLNSVAGLATFSNLAFSTPGTYQLVAFSGSLATDTSVMFTVSGPPAKLIITQQPPSSIVAGQTVGTLTVAVRDSSNNLVSTDTSVVTLTISTGPAGALFSNATGATFSNATASVVNGIATFTGLAFDTAGTSYKLTAADAGLTSATTNSFKVTPDLTTAHLTLASSPASSLVGVKPTTAYVIDVIDKFNNIITTDGSQITLTKTAGPGTLSGTLSVKASKGVATFSNVLLSMAGSYTLLATDPKFSSPSTVTNGTISFTAIATPAITTIAAPSLSKSYNFGSTITLSGTIKSLVSTPVGFTNQAFLVDANDSTNTHLATVTVASNGSIKFSLNTITANFTGGTHTMRIIYQGDTNHTGGQSPTFNLVVAPASTTTVLAASSLNLTTSQTLTLSATVNTFTGATVARTGMVVIKDNGTPISGGTLSLTSSSAFIDLTPLVAGTHKYSFSYLGDANYKSSNSSTLTVKVT